MNDFVTYLQDCLKAAKKHMAEEQRRMNDPCWQLEWTHIVASDIAKKIADGTIPERDVWLYSIDSRQVWINVCDESD